MANIRKSPTPDYDPEGCTRLANAVVVLAAKDYRRSLKALKKNPNNRMAMDMAMECERFFDSSLMEAYTTIDGHWLKNKLREEAKVL